MTKKVGTSVVLRLDQVNWIEDKDGSMSETVREAVDCYMENHE